MLSEELYNELVRCAVMAPSGHNTQPWLFSKKKNTIVISPDFRRALPVADPQNRELYISLGCAAETAMIALRNHGFEPELKVSSTSGITTLEIDLAKAETKADSDLYTWISTRQTARGTFAKDLPARHVSEQLRDAIASSNVRLYFIQGKEAFELLSPYLAEANRVQTAGNAYRNELIQWMRFSRSEAIQKSDGLYTASSGLPTIGRTFGGWLIKQIITTANEEKRQLKLLKTTPLFAIIATNGDDHEQWVQTGLALQRIALTATKLGIAHAYLNTPCQVETVRKKLASTKLLQDSTPQVIIRLGYAKPMPRAFRRSAKEVMINLTE